MANHTTTTAPPLTTYLFAKGTARVKAPANLYRYGGTGMERDTLVLAEEAGARPTQVWVARSEGGVTWAEEMSAQGVETVWRTVLQYRGLFQIRPPRPERTWPTVPSPYGRTVRSASNEEAEAICPGLLEEIARWGAWASQTFAVCDALTNADERSAFDQIASTI